MHGRRLAWGAYAGARCRARGKGRSMQAKLRAAAAMDVQGEARAWRMLASKEAEMVGRGMDEARRGGIRSPGGACWRASGVDCGGLPLTAALGDETPGRRLSVEAGDGDGGDQNVDEALLTLTMEMDEASDACDGGSRCKGKGPLQRSTAQRDQPTS